MKKSAGLLWHRPTPDWVQPKLQDLLVSHPDVRIFFRADDIAVVDEPFSHLMQLFQTHRIALNLAMVPEWMNARRWEEMKRFTADDRLWCWHQHGFAHVNHETAGKKCEFGDSRGRLALLSDIQKGYEQLAYLLGNVLFPVFTPPWNRCGQLTLDILQQLKFSGISRYRQPQPQSPGGLEEIGMNVDLHTGRENDYQEGWSKMLADFSRAAETGTIGIMIHHQLMNREAFTFLDNLLQFIRATGITTWTFREQLNSSCSSEAL